MDRPTLTLLPATELARAAFPAPEAILGPILSRARKKLRKGVKGAPAAQPRPVEPKPRDTEPKA